MRDACYGCGGKGWVESQAARNKATPIEEPEASVPSDKDYIDTLRYLMVSKPEHITGASLACTGGGGY